MSIWQSLFAGGTLAVGMACLNASPASADIQTVFAKQPHGPSFNCSRVILSRVESRICKSTILSKLDLALNDAYAEDAFGSRAIMMVVADQAAWLRFRNACVSEACLADRYRRRLEQMRLDIRVEQREWQSDWRQEEPKDTRLSRSLARDAAVPCFRLGSMVDLGDRRASFLASYVDSSIGKSCREAHRLMGTDFHTRALVLYPHGGRYRVVFDQPSVYVSGICCFPQNERSHGLRRITTFSRSGAAEHYRTLYDFDGRVYRQIATVDLDAWDPSGHKVLTVTRP